MRKIIAKTVSVALVCAMAATVASCGKTKKTGKEIRKISEDSPWFDASITDVETGAEKGREIGTWLNQQFVASDDQYYFIETRGEYQIPPDDKIDVKTFNYRDYQFDHLAVVDRNTRQTVNTIDLKKELTASEPFTDNIFSNNGKITVQSKLKERDYDPLTGELLDTRPRKASDDDLFTRHYFIGSYEVETIVYQTETNQRYSRISVKGPDGEVRENELKKPDKEMYINYVLADGDTKAVISVSVGRNLEEDVYYELDLETNKLTVADQKKYEWLDEVSLYNSICCPDGTIYFMDSEGVFKINAEKKTTEKLFDYNQCGLNIGLIDCFDLVECSDDRILLCGRCDNPSVYEGRTADKINLIELTRADKNPHSGKTVLEIFSPNGIDDKTGEAVTRFNETNSKYFIEYAFDYDDRDNYDDTDDESNEDVWMMTKTRNNSSLSNKLAIDIMNGDAPDILLDCSSLSVLNNSNCLADLTPFVKDSDPDKYFTNIIEGSKTDGVIYQLPVSFRLEGIMTKTANAGSSGKGFTLDEYQKFTDEVMNGNDPLIYGQAVYFSLLFNSMRDEFISKGKVDLSKPEFKILADYVKDNVRENGISINDWYQKAAGGSGIPKGEYIEYCTGIGGYYFYGMGIASYGRGVAMLGLPSLDGRGPRFIPSRSVAISSQATDIKACGEFVKLLLTDEFQTKVAMNDEFVLSREAYKAAGSAAVTYYTNGGSSYMGGNGSGAGGMTDFTSKDVDFVENVILSCSKMKTEDPDISMILIEEMPAYFLGQKNLDAVIKIAENRIQKVLDERG